MTVHGWIAGVVLAGSVTLTGCGGGSSPTAPQPAREGQDGIAANLAKLSGDDKLLAEAQKVCPVTGESLGSMGVPPKITLNGEAIFLCCSGCKGKAEADPDKALNAVADAKAGYEYFCPMHPAVVRYRNKEKCPICSMPLSKQKKREQTDDPLPAAPATPSSPTPKLFPEDLAEIRASLAKLPPADKKAAEAQRLCPVRGDSLLGSMGVPVKVTLNGTPVFLCCKACMAEAQKDPDKTLKAVADAKAKSGTK